MKTHYLNNDLNNKLVICCSEPLTKQTKVTIFQEEVTCETCMGNYMEKQAKIQSLIDVMPIKAMTDEDISREFNEMDRLEYDED